MTKFSDSGLDEIDERIFTLVSSMKRWSTCSSISGSDAWRNDSQLRERSSEYEGWGENLKSWVGSASFFFERDMWFVWTGVVFEKYLNDLRLNKFLVKKKTISRQYLSELIIIWSFINMKPFLRFSFNSWGTHLSSFFSDLLEMSRNCWNITQGHEMLWFDPLRWESLTDHCRLN